jgi:integration host factor subunit alpha
MAKGVAGAMSDTNVTRAALADVVYPEVSLSRSQAADMVGQILQEISDTLAVGETVKLSGFGIVAVRHQSVLPSIRTNVEVTIELRRACLLNWHDCRLRLRGSDSRLLRDWQSSP